MLVSIDDLDVVVSRASSANERQDECEVLIAVGPMHDTENGVGNWNKSLAILRCFTATDLPAYPVPDIIPLQTLFYSSCYPTRAIPLERLAGRHVNVCVCNF